MTLDDRHWRHSDVFDVKFEHIEQLNMWYVARFGTIYTI